VRDRDADTVRKGSPQAGGAERKELEDAPLLTDHDRRAIEIIRRQLDQEYPHLDSVHPQDEHEKRVQEREESVREDTSGPKRATRSVVVMAVLGTCIVGAVVGTASYLARTGSSRPDGSSVTRATPPSPAPPAPPSRQLWHGSLYSLRPPAGAGEERGELNGTRGQVWQLRAC